jgi:hypothetical protein
VTKRSYCFDKQELRNCDKEGKLTWSEGDPVNGKVLVQGIHHHLPTPTTSRLSSRCWDS